MLNSGGINRLPVTVSFLCFLSIILAESIIAYGNEDMRKIEESNVSLNLIGGARLFSIGSGFTKNGKEIKSQNQFGINVDYRFGWSPIRVSAGYFESSSSNGRTTLSLSEIRLGVREYQEYTTFSTYYGLGLARISGKHINNALGSDVLNTYFNKYKLVINNSFSETVPDVIKNAKSIATLDQAIDSRDSIDFSKAKDIKDLYGESSTIYADLFNTNSKTASTLGFYYELGGAI